MSLDQLLASSAYLRLRQAALSRTLNWSDLEDWVGRDTYICRLQSSPSASVLTSAGSAQSSVLLDLRKEKCSRGLRISATVVGQTGKLHADLPKPNERRVWEADFLDDKLERLFGRQIRVSVRFNLQPLTQAKLAQVLAD